MQATSYRITTKVRRRPTPSTAKATICKDPLIVITLLSKYNIYCLERGWPVTGLTAGPIIEVHVVIADQVEEHLCCLDIEKVKSKQEHEELNH